MAKTQPDANAFMELGRSGLVTSGGYVMEDFVWKLRGQKGAKIYREIVDNSAVAGACMQSLRQIMSSTVWLVDPADKFDDEAVKIAQFVQECMEDMDPGWDEAISEAHSMLQYGYAPLEVVYKRRTGPKGDPPSRFTDGKIGWRKMSLRSQESITQWVFDYEDSAVPHPCGDIRGVVQSAAPTYVEVTIPADKFLLFRTTSERGNPEGRSLLRSAYYSYYFAKKLAEQAGIGAERDLCGIPVGRGPASALMNSAPTDQATSAAALRQIVETIRNNEQASLILPSDVDEKGNYIWNVELMKAAGSRQFDVLALVQHFELRMALAMLMDAILLGHEQIGTQALAASKGKLLSMCIKGFLDREASVLNSQALPRLLKLNGWDTTKCPRLSHTGVDDADTAGLAAYLKTLADAGVDVFPDEILTRHLYGLAKLPIEGRVQAEEEATDEGEESPEKPVETAEAAEEAQAEETDTDTPAEAEGGGSSAVTPQQEAEAQGVALNLNGAQIQAAADIVRSVAVGELPRDSGIGQLEILLGLTRAQAEHMVGSAGTDAFTGQKPAPTFEST